MTLESILPGGVIVHCGMPKTGSTSIQVSLFRHLDDPRFHYVNLGRPNVNIQIANAFMLNPVEFHQHAKLGTSPRELMQLKKAAVESLEAGLAAAGDRTAILSSEAISGLNKPEFRNLCDMLTRHRRTITVVGYVRRPKEIMESALQQRLKSGTWDFTVDSLFPKYRRRFRKFDAVLGRKHVRVWLYEPETFPGGCVVRDFCSRLGISFNARNVVRANERLSLPAISLLFAYRRFGPGYGVGPAALKENMRLVRHISGLRGPKLHLHSSLVAPVLEEHREDIEWMEERLGTSLAEDLSAHDDEGAVRSEEDLLRFSPESLRWLAEQLGGDYVERWHPEMSPQEVADWMHQLRLKLAASDKETQMPRKRGAPGALSERI